MIKLPACLDQDCQLKIRDGSYIFVPNTILLLIVEVVAATAQNAHSKHTFPGNCKSAYQDSSRATIQIKQQSKSSKQFKSCNWSQLKLKQSAIRHSAARAQDACLNKILQISNQVRFWDVWRQGNKPLGLQRLKAPTKYFKRISRLQILNVTDHLLLAFNHRRRCPLFSNIELIKLNLWDEDVGGWWWVIRAKGCVSCVRLVWKSGSESTHILSTFAHILS